MKFRHVAALALVGWYLVLPPISPSGIDVSAPLSKWTVYQNYESFRRCFAAETELHKRGEQDLNVMPPLQFPPRQLEQFAAADCVVSDDSRLKSN